MIRHSPCEYYIKYLVVSGLSNEEVIRVCHSHDFPYLGNWYINRFREECVPPNPFLPNDPTHVPTRDFINREMIRLAYFPNDTMKRALEILDKPRIRELVEVMILSGAPHDAVVHALAVRSNFRCDEKVIDIYRHYFWEIDLLDSADMRALLKLKYDEVLNSNDPQIKYQYEALKKSFYDDPRVVASKLPVSPLSALVAQVSLGVMPKNINILDVLTQVRMMSALRAYQAAIVNGPSSADQGASYMSMSNMAHQMMETVIKPEDQLRNDLMNIGLKTKAFETQVIAKLTDGKHTVDLQPEPEPAPELAIGEIDGPSSAEKH